MIEALYIAATGMHAEQRQLDVIANNMANLNTSAYKKERASFDSLIALGNTSSPVLSVETKGMGSTVSHVERTFTPGDLKNTGNPYDLAISGEGFFEVLLPDGSVAFTRDGSFKTDENGLLTTRHGYSLAQQFRIPPDARAITVSERGEITADLGNGQEDTLGTLELARFTSNSSLQSLGNNLFLATEQSGTPFFSVPGENGTGLVQQNHIETSNVDLVEELMNLTVAQRAYEVNSQVIKAADEIMRINNSLRV
ncbi:flagellar basal-body rod protein FlgG [Parendozoicomonas haliclonae]|uniref:Flagellar basal-body rod protein FlgG n=1 Tax=Parendozoicomonas haliclonae TaxID=1960125 RepID=A0A1X7ANN4_9GAMM|nr:flagellar basal-body rod protein FlgG [Parendozoicomonas haliclonae]SMA49875.1 Flagellar basal-body rod protein FlgG [Parendozoicomonas haliclonae]